MGFLLSGVLITHLYHQESFSSLRWSLSAAKIAVLNTGYGIIVILSLNAFLFSFSSAVFMLLWNDITEAIHVCSVDKWL